MLQAVARYVGAYFMEKLYTFEANKNGRFRKYCAELMLKERRFLQPQKALP